MKHRCGERGVNGSSGRVEHGQSRTSSQLPDALLSKRAMRGVDGARICSPVQICRFTDVWNGVGGGWEEPFSPPPNSSPLTAWLTLVEVTGDDGSHWGGKQRCLRMFLCASPCPREAVNLMIHPEVLIIHEVPNALKRGAGWGERRKLGQSDCLLCPLLSTHPSLCSSPHHHQL